MDRSIDLSIDQPINQSLNHSMNEPFNIQYLFFTSLSARTLPDQLIIQSISQPIDQCIYPFINQPNHIFDLNLVSYNQLINQSMSISTKTLYLTLTWFHLSN